MNPHAPTLAEIVDRHLLPRPCLGCEDLLIGQAARLGLCRRCHGQLAPVDRRDRCTRCLRTLPARVAAEARCLRCAASPDALSRVVAVWWFREPLRSVIHAFKFRRLDFLAEAMAREALTREPLAHLPPVDCVVPVPLPFWRRLARGFDQADRIAGEVARALDRPKLAAVLRSPWRARRQSRLGRAERQRDFDREWRLRAVMAPALRGRSVLLVDDVMTTGTTLLAVATLLRGAGAREVSALALAATPDLRSERLDRPFPAP